jgi:hypothetical protein
MPAENGNGTPESGGSSTPDGPDDWVAQIHNAKSARRSKKWIGASVAAGGTTLVNLMSGGGSQPEDVLPATAVAFVKLDLDPSAGQKLAAYQLSGKFPKVKSKVSGEETSIKESIFGTLFTGDTKKGALSMGLNYKTDVEPWLGDRVGVGVFPDLDADKQPEVGIAIAFTDQGAAKAALDKAIAHQTIAHKTIAHKTIAPKSKTKPEMGYAFAEDFVVVSDTTAHAAALVGAGKTASLAGSTYGEDVKKLGEDQVAVAWVDMERTFKAVKAALPKEEMQGLVKVDESKLGGRIVEGLHLDASYVELTAMGVDVKGDAVVNTDVGADAGLIESFPSGVLAAFTGNGFGKSLGAAYTSITKPEGDAKSKATTSKVNARLDSLGIKSPTHQCTCAIRSMFRSLGLDSAKKIENLLGSETGVMVAGDNLRKPQVAIQTRGSNPDAAVAAARKALARIPVPGGLQIRKVAAPPGVFIGTPATGRGFNLVKETFNASGKKLGGDEAFRQVIPPDQKASFAAYVNLSNVLPLLAKTPDSDLDMATLRPFKALGFTATGGTDPTVRLRVSFK